MLAAELPFAVGVIYPKAYARDCVRRPFESNADAPRVAIG
jgi:hypothetical protein